jgi:hypothetical protein
VRGYKNIEEVTSSLTSGLDVPRSIQSWILVIVCRLVDDNDDDMYNINNNNNSFLLGQFVIIYVLAQQPQGQINRQHRKIRKIQRYKQQMKSHIKNVKKKSHLRITA